MEIVRAASVSAVTEEASPDLCRELTESLTSLLTERRRQRIDDVLAQRTRRVTVVLENIGHPQNAGAVLRTCECLGVQDVHIVADRNPFRVVAATVAGAAKWLTLFRYDDPGAPQTRVCLDLLHRRGYRIAGTTLRSGAIPLEELPLDRPVALAFGSERQGLSEEAHGLCDFLVQIPMHGFTQSFNISVAAAICLFQLTGRLREMDAGCWGLSEEEKAWLRLEWVLKSIRNRHVHVARFFAERGRDVPDCIRRLLD